MTTGVRLLDPTTGARRTNAAVKIGLAAAFAVALLVPLDHLDGKAMPARAPIFLASAVLVPVIGRRRGWDPYPHVADALLVAASIDVAPAAMLVLDSTAHVITVTAVIEGTLVVPATRRAGIDIGTARLGGDLIVEALVPSGERGADASVVLLAPAHAEPEIEAPAADEIHRGDLLGQQHGRVPRGDGEVDHDPHPLGERRGRRERRDHLDVVIRDPLAARVGGERAVVGDAAPVDQRRPIPAVGHGWQGEPDVHGGRA